MVDLLLLDLDGTVRRTRSGKKFINEPTDQEIIPEAVSTIRAYVAAGATAIGITNQGGVMHGYKSFESCVEEQFLTIGFLPELTEILFCPDNGKNCYEVSGYFEVGHFIDYWNISEAMGWLEYEALHRLKGKYRKPDPGMLRYALWQYQEPDITVKALYVGDRPEDAEAAMNAGIPFLFAQQWYNSDPVTVLRSI